MTYVKVQWIHSVANEPVWLYSELDENRYERRKVEVFVDGTKGFASAGGSFNGTILGEMPLPTNGEIGRDPQFVVESISKSEFEALWNEAERDSRKNAE